MLNKNYRTIFHQETNRTKVWTLSHFVFQLLHHQSRSYSKPWYWVYCFTKKSVKVSTIENILFNKTLGKRLTLMKFLAACNPIKNWTKQIHWQRVCSITTQTIPNPTIFPDFLHHPQNINGSFPSHCTHTHFPHKKKNKRTINTIHTSFIWNDANEHKAN